MSSNRSPGSDREPLPTKLIPKLSSDGTFENPQIPGTDVDPLANTQEIPVAEIKAAMASHADATKIANDAAENPNSFSLSLPHLNHEQIFNSLGFSSTPEVKTAKKRTASYFILDAATISDPTNQQKIRNEISIISNSRDFIVTQDNNGNLIIFSLSERGGVEKIFDIERSLRAAIPTSKALIGDCTLYNEGEGLTLVDSSLDPEAAQIFSSTETGFTCVSDRLATKIADPSSRIGSNTKLHTKNHPDSKLRILVEAISRVSEELGGPDKMIGYEEELAALLLYATDDATNIISLEAAGGMGKSRIRTELLRKLPNSILCSMNPSDKNIQGSSLTTISKQLEDILKSEATDNPEQATEESVQYQIFAGVSPTGEFNYKDCAITLTEFNSFPHAKKIKFAAIYPETVKELCLSAMRKLRSLKNPKTLFVIEDLHHADRISEPHIIELIKEFSAINGDEQGKVLVTSRPEEMFQSLAFKKLKTDPANKQKLKTLKLNGLNLLTDHSLSREFAFHSLPPEIRVDEKGRDLKMRDWCYSLSYKAKNSPWIMKSYMDQICEYDEASGTYPNIIIQDGKIEVSKEVIDKITRINPEDDRDIANYFQERLAALPEVSLKFLQYIALMEEKLGTWDGIQILNKLMGLDNSQLVIQSETLSRAGYITHDSVRGEYCKLQHESTRDIVLASIDPTEKVEMAKSLFELFRDNDGITQKVKYNLATIIAKTIPGNPFHPLEVEDFLSEYFKLSGGLLEEAAHQHDIKRIIEIATEGLSIPTTQSCLTGLKENRCNYNSETVNATLDYIFRIAENSRLSGQFDQTEKALASLKEVYARFPSKVDVVRMHRISFDKACMQYDLPSIKAAHKAMMECGKPISQTQQAIIDILLAHYEDRHDDVDKIYEKNKTLIETEANEYTKKYGMPSPQQLELRRICEAKNPYERIRRNNEIEGQSYDDDVIMHPGSLSAENLATMVRIDQILEKIEKTRRAHPLGIDSHSELKIIEQQAGVKAFLGSHDEAVKLFAEAWRIANQMGLHEAAARIAKLKGDTFMTQALLLPAHEETQKIDLLRKALQTYSVEGIEQSGEKIDETSDYKFILRLERLWAISSLMIELHKVNGTTENDQTQIEFQELITMAIADLEFMNTPAIAEMATNPQHKYYGVIHFYLMGSVGHITRIAKIHDIEIDNNIFDEAKNPYMNLGRIENAQAFGNYLTDLNLGKVQTTLDGLNHIAKVLRRKQNREFNKKRQNRDKGLARDNSIPSAPKAATYKLPIGFGTSREVTIEERLDVPEELVAEIQSIQSIYLELERELGNSRDLSETQKVEPLSKINNAINIYLEINQKYPQFANDPRTVYHLASLIGHIIYFANEAQIPVDESVFNGDKCPFSKTKTVKATYSYAQTVYDFGEKLPGQRISVGEQKSEGLFTLLSILQEKEFVKKKEDRSKKDNDTLAKRRSATVS